MFRPTTDLGKYFSEETHKLSGYFVDTGKKQSHEQQEEASHAVHNYFQAVESLPDQIEKLEYSLSVLFEIDQAIAGVYGAKVFSETNVTPMRKLLRDIIALWYRYHLLAKLERKNSIYLEIRGIRSFYENWIESEQVGINESEYDRIVGNVAMLLENNENLEEKTRVLLFKMLGTILVTLGISAGDAENSLVKYIQEIRERGEITLFAYAEILINLHVLHDLNNTFQNLRNIDYYELHKAIRYWCAIDPFFEKLFKSWNEYWENDFLTPLPKGDELQLSNNKASLLSQQYTPAMKLGIGQSFLEFTEHKSQNQGLTSIFQPVPIFMFGFSGVGKTAYLTSFCYDAQMKVAKGGGFGSGAITLGRELQTYYQNNVNSWYNNSIPPTAGYNQYTFWEDLNIGSFLINDYEARKDNVQLDERDQRMNMEVMELYKNARGLLFFLSEADYTNPVELRRKSSQFDSFLQYWMQSNPHIKHIPVALVLTKADMVFGETISMIPRPGLLPDSFQPALVENFVQHRIASPNAAQLTTPYSRLRDSILNDKSNNKLPAFQDIVQMIFDNFEQFFSRVLELTYNYQIFFTASVPPPSPNDKTFPFGAREPLSWVATVLEKYYIKETIEKYDSEEEQINTNIRTILEDIKKLNELKEEHAKWQEEIDHLQESQSLLVVMTRKMKIDGYLRSRESAEKKLVNILEKYGRKFDANIAKTIQDIEDQAVTMKNTVTALNDKKRSYENRKAALSY